MNLLVATDLPPEEADVLIRFADVVDAGGWEPDGRASSDGWETGSGPKANPNALSSTARLLRRDGSALAIHRTGSTACGFELVERGNPVAHLQIDLRPPHRALDAANRSSTARWAAGIARAVHAAPREPYRRVVMRAAGQGHAVALVADMHRGARGGMSWHPPTPWSDASFGDMFRFVPVPNAVNEILKERTAAIGLAVPSAASAFRRWSHRIQRLDVPLDQAEAPSATEAMRTLRDLGLTAAHFAPDDA